MDFGTFNSYTPTLTSEFWATSASLVTAAAALLFRARRVAAVRSVRPPVRPSLHPAPVVSAPAPVENTSPLLSGLYRGRSVEMACGPEKLLYVSVRLLSLLPPESPWEAAGPHLRARLAALPRPLLLCTVGGFLHLAVPNTSNAPEARRVLLDLACDLADAAEGILPAAPLLASAGAFAVAKNPSKS